MNTDLMNLINYVSLNRDAFPETWRDLAPIIEAQKHETEREADIERVYEQSRAFRAKFSRFYEPNIRPEAPRGAIPWDFKPQMREMGVETRISAEMARTDATIEAMGRFIAQAQAKLAPRHRFIWSNGLERSA